MALSTSSKFLFRFTRVFSRHSHVCMPGGEWGSGAGKGGGSGGAVRDAGGGFGKMEAAREEEYFRKLQKKQLDKLKEHISDEVSHLKRLIQNHKEAITRLEERINSLKASARDPEKET